MHIVYYNKGLNMRNGFLFAISLFSASAMSATIAPDLGTILAPNGFFPPGTGAGIFDSGGQGLTPNDLDGIGDDTDFFELIEFTASTPTGNSFGLYQIDPFGVAQDFLPVFTGSDTGLPMSPAFESVDWNIITGAASTSLGIADFSETLLFALPGWEIGAYLATAGAAPGAPGTFYTHDFLNPGGIRQVGVFDTSPGGGPAGDIVFAWEDLRIASGGFVPDYDDMIVLATDISPRLQQVPEPASFALFGLGGLMFAASRRKLKT